jgi:hypothetical protein
VEELIQKLKETIKSAKEMVVRAGDNVAYKDIPSDPLTDYEYKESTSSAKIKDHDTTLAKVKMNTKMTEWQKTKEEFTEPEQASTNPEEAAEKARSDGGGGGGMTKETSGSGKTSSEYKQGSAP